MNISQLISVIDDFAWGPVMLILLVGTGIYLSARMRFIQFTRIPYWWKNTAGKLFHKHEAGDGEVTPLAPATSPASPAPSSSAAPARSSGCGSRPWPA